MAALGLHCCSGVSLVVASGASPGCGARFALHWLLLFQSTGSRVLRFSSRSTWLVSEHGLQGAQVSVLAARGFSGYGPPGSRAHAQ